MVNNISLGTGRIYKICNDLDSYSKAIFSIRDERLDINLKQILAGSARILRSDLINLYNSLEERDEPNKGTIEKYISKMVADIQKYLDIMDEDQYRETIYSIDYTQLYRRALESFLRSSLIENLPYLSSSIDSAIIFMADALVLIEIRAFDEPRHKDYI